MKIERRIADDLLILTLQDTRIDAVGAVPFKEAVRPESSFWTAADWAHSWRS